MPAFLENRPPATAERAADGARSGAGRESRFHLVRYFALTGFAVFLVVAAALLYFVRQESKFFRQVQQDQLLFFRQVQEDFARQQDEAARGDLLRMHEADSVNLAQLFANTLWPGNFAPFVARAQQITVARCRAIADVKDAGGKPVPPAGKKACYQEIRSKIIGLPGFRALDARVFSTMRKSTVFKIKVFDLRGITVYSSEHVQIGEDKSDNAGWQSAAGGKPASELIYRDRFSAFEHVVENRDLASSYLPVLDPGSGKIAGVFEIYSDVTPLLDQIKSTSSQIRKLGAVQQERAERAAAANQSKVDEAANLMLGTVIGLLALLYCSLFLIVRNGQRIIDRRDIERKQAEEAQREAAEQLNSFVEQSIAGIYIVQDGKFTYVNPRLAEIFGYASPGEIVGKSPFDLTAPKDRAAVAENIRRRLAGEVKSISYSFTGLRKDGIEFDAGVHGSFAIYQGRPAIMGLLQDITERKHAEDQIRRYIERLEQAMRGTIGVVTAIGEARDPYTQGHERRVGEIAASIAAEMGLDPNRVEGIRIAGYLHDVGKIGVPAEILSKPGKLTKAEFELVKDHAQRSYEILKGVDFPWPIAQVAWQHHERLDGSGYPRGLKGGEIILEARVLSVADVLEAMSSHRPYRPGLGIEAALAEIEKNRGKLYDPQVVDSCLRLFREKGYTLPA